MVEYMKKQKNIYLAQLLDLPLSTVLSKYHRAIPKLRAFLSEEGIT